MISLQNLDRTHAFSDSDQQLLETLAGSLSVALENARLVHETRQRNAELALINSVQESIAGELDEQAIYDLVGEKLREIFDAQVLDIAVYDETAGILRFVVPDRARRSLPERDAAGHRLPQACDGDAPSLSPSSRTWTRPSSSTTTRRRSLGEPSHGSAIVPAARRGRRATGVISIQDLDREHAFDDSDQRLLATIAGSLGVALDNAQLVARDAPTNAELALINSVQAAIAGELDPQAIYDLVGDKLQEVFDAQVVTSRSTTRRSGLLHFPVHDRARRALRRAADPPDRLPQARRWKRASR